VDLEALADPDAAPGLLVSATDIEEGQIVYFYSWDKGLSLDHIVASGSLPPGFPMTVIGGKTYWDGGLFDNTPLGAVLDRLDTSEHAERTIYVVNLFPNKWPVPGNMQEVTARTQNLQFANKTLQDLKMLGRIDEVAALMEALEALPEAIRSKTIRPIRRSPNATMCACQRSSRSRARNRSSALAAAISRRIQSRSGRARATSKRTARCCTLRRDLCRMAWVQIPPERPGWALHLASNWTKSRARHSYLSGEFGERIAVVKDAIGRSEERPLQATGCGTGKAGASFARVLDNCESASPIMPPLDEWQNLPLSEGSSLDSFLCSCLPSCYYLLYHHLVPSN
jgi:hypothetical protein